MIRNFYSEANRITSDLSGGRQHYGYREPSTVNSAIEHIVTYGESPYTLAEKLFGDDSMYWIITDVNEPRDAMSWEPGEKIILPQEVVEHTLEDIEAY